MIAFDLQREYSGLLTYQHKFFTAILERNQQVRLGALCSLIDHDHFDLRCNLRDIGKDENKDERQ